MLIIDADERVSARLRGEIEKELQNPRAMAYSAPRLVYYINRWIRHCGWYPARRTRLFRRDAGIWAGENPHDHLEVNGRTAKLPGDIYHLSFDNISDHLATIDNFTEVAAQVRIDKGGKAGLFEIFLRPPATFLKMYILKIGFLDGIPGFIASVLSAYHVFCKYVKIAEMSRN